MDIDIVYPEIKCKRSRHEISIMEDFETRTFEDVVYTREIFIGTKSNAEPGSEPNAELNAETSAEPNLEPGVEPGAGHNETKCDADEITNETELLEVIKEISIEDFYLTMVSRTAEQCDLELAAPQRSAEWLEARRHCITASNFGAAAGNNKYMSKKALVIDKLWATFKGNAYTAYGTFHENDARDSFTRALNGDLMPTLEDMYYKKFNSKLIDFNLFETGLLKSHEQPWMAVSPDGLLRLNGPNGHLWILVEYKCPARLRDTDGHPYANYKNNIPEYYMDQIQGIMGLFNKKPDLFSMAEKTAGLCASSKPAIDHTMFVIWQPHQIHVTLLPFDHKYYSTSLEPSLESWYFTKYLPLAVLKYNNCLIHGTDTSCGSIVV